MKSKAVTFLRLLSCLIVGTSLAGCATIQPIPYATGGLRIEKSLSERKIDRQLTLGMTEELLKLVVTINPLQIPENVSYNLYVGESIRANLVNTLRPLFSSVNVSSLKFKEKASVGAMLNIDLKSYDFRIAPSIFGKHTVRLSIEYSGYDESGKGIFMLLTETSGTSDETPGIGKTWDDWRRFAMPREPITAAPYIHSIGNAYDVALGESISELLTKLNEAWIHLPQGG